MPQSIRYFVTGHTANGLVDYLSSNIVDIENIIVLQHNKQTVLTHFFKKIINNYDDGIKMELISHPQGKDDIAGIIIRDKNLAVLDEAIVLKPIKRAKYIQMDRFINWEGNEKNPEKENELYQQAYAYFQKGLLIHDDLEKVYINEMNFNKADKVANEFIHELLKDVKKKDSTVHVYERLFGTNTPYGVVNYVDDIIEPIENTFYIKGRAGTGKSFFMKKVFQACENYGFDIELYHCSFDPNSIDMVIVRDLDFCIFDSTPPHEFFPKKSSDRIVDLYDLTVTPGTDEKFEDSIRMLTKTYKEQMKCGIETLKQIKPFYEKEEIELDIELFLGELGKMI